MKEIILNGGPHAHGSILSSYQQDPRTTFQLTPTPKVLLVNGSPHAHGCTYTALQEIAQTLQNEGIESDIFQVGTRPLSGCLGCGRCSDKGKCVMNDAVNEFLAKAADYDAFVFGAPVHFASANGAMIAFMDRVFCAGKQVLQFKPAAAVVSCRRAGSTATFDQLNKYFAIRHMPIVTSQYWNQVHGNTPEEVRRDLEGMQTMRSLGRNMAWLLHCIEAGKQAGFPHPEHEKQTKTNFIR